MARQPSPLLQESRSAPNYLPVLVQSQQECIVRHPVHDLEKAGFDRQKAEAAAAALGNASLPGQDQLATKADLHKVALAIVAINSGVTFGLLKLLLP